MSELDSIATDVSSDKVDLSDVSEEKSIPTSSGRDDVMAQILANRKEGLKHEGTELDTDLEVPEVVEEEPDEEVVADAEGEEVVDSDPNEGETDSIKVKVDGEEFDVSPKQIRDYQVNIAADRRLKEANRIKAEAEVEKIRLQKKFKELEQQNAEEGRKAFTTEDARTLMKSMFDEEDPDKVAELLNKLTPETSEEKTLEQPSFDPKQVFEMVSKAVDQKTYLNEADEADQYFREHYSKYAKNPVMFGAVQTRISQLAEVDSDVGPMQLMKQAVTDVKADLKKLGVNDIDEEVKTQNDSKTNERLEVKKKSAKKVVHGKAQAKANINKEKAPPPTRQTIVAQIVADRNNALAGIRR